MPPTNRRKLAEDIMAEDTREMRGEAHTPPQFYEPPIPPRERVRKEMSTTTTTPTTTSSTTTTKPKEQDRTEYGIGYGDQDSPRSYLGHFGKDQYAERGHNVGSRKVKTVDMSDDIAKNGYRRIPGSASPQIGVAEAFTADGIADTGLKRKPWQEKIDESYKRWIKKKSNIGSDTDSTDPYDDKFKG